MKKSLIIFSGPPCSGKTYYIQKHFSQYFLVSTDQEFKYFSDSQFTLYEKNLQALENSYVLLCESCKQGVPAIVYDSTNLTFERREKLLAIAKEYNYDITTIFLDTSFEGVLDNWNKRGKDIKLETLFALYCLYDKKSSLIGKNLYIHKHSTRQYKSLHDFLEGKNISKKQLFSQNPDIKILCDIWKKGGKDFLDEYQKKLEYFEEISLEEKFALFYSEVKYFYQDYLIHRKFTYNISREDFIAGFFENIMDKKLKKFGWNKKNVLTIFKKCINSF